MPTWTLERRGAIALLTFTRPPRNFMSFAAMTELEGVLEPLAADETTSVVVLTGGLAGYFIAHADLDDLNRIAGGEQAEGDPGRWGRVLDLVVTVPEPVVAAG